MRIRKTKAELKSERTLPAVLLRVVSWLHLYFEQSKDSKYDDFGKDHRFNLAAQDLNLSIKTLDSYMLNLRYAR